MTRIALARKLVATTVAAIACGGVAWASAAVVPAGGHRSASEVSDTTVGPDSTTAPDATSTTAGEATTTTADESTTTTVDEPTSTTTEPVTTTTVGTPSSAPCNHGANVSQVAHDAPRGHDAEPGAHGKAVSAAAHEKCPGKTGDDDAAEPDDSPRAGTEKPKSHGPGGPHRSAHLPNA